MAPRPIKTQLLAAISTKKKNFKKKKDFKWLQSRNPPHISTKGYVSGKGKEVAAEIESEGKLSPSMDTKEE